MDLVTTDPIRAARTWRYDINIPTCIHKLFCTEAGSGSLKDVWSSDSELIFVWCTHKEVCIWNTRMEIPAEMVGAISDFSTTNLKISGDGSMVFLQDHKYVQALSVWTGEVVGVVKLDDPPSNEPLIVDGSRIWVCFENSQTQGWDFGAPDLAPVLLSEMPPSSDRPHLDFINSTKGQNAGPSRIVDVVTGKEVFQLPTRYQGLTIVRWDGHYLVAGSRSQEMLILDFTHMISQ